MNGDNEMIARKKMGISLFAIGAAAIMGGVLAITLPADPAWWISAIPFIGLVAEFFGFKFVYPDVQEKKT